MKFSEKADISKRYAIAIFELASAQKKVAEVEAELSKLASLYLESKTFKNFSENLTLSVNDLKNGVTALAKKAKCSGLLQGLLSVLAANRRLALIPEISRQYHLLALSSRGEVEAVITSAAELKSKELGALVDALEKVLKLKVQPIAKVDKSIIGGLKVRVGSSELDLSVAAKLDKLQQTLKKGISGTL